jgi:hypothetical protein
MTTKALLSASILFFALGGCHRHHIREPDPLTTQEIIGMAKAGKAVEEILHEIDSSGTVYLMDSKDVIDLNAQGVDRRVIDHMMRTRERAAARRCYYHPYDHDWCYYGHFHGPFIYCW